MSIVDPIRELVLLVRSGHQILHLNSDEDDRIAALLLHVAERLDHPLFIWTRIRGLGRVDLPGTVYDTDDPAKAFRHVAASDQHIADLRSLKAWLAKRKAVVTQPERAEEFGLDFPRGVLLLGVPGCGKSLSAKAVAAEWHMPLLKLDPSNLYNKYIGESERNFKRAMRTVEQIAPVVLWIDELEKAFATGGEDGGVSQRVLGSFLTWMQDRNGDVFVVATANDISRLPAEFLRKGRFDEIFFVDLPDAATRAEIFRIHLTNRGQDSSAFHLETLGAATDGYSGSEIEEVVVSSLYTAFSTSAELTMELLLSEAEGTVPLSVSRAEHVEELRAWARERARPAN